MASSLPLRGKPTPPEKEEGEKEKGGKSSLWRSWVFLMKKQTSDSTGGRPGGTLQWRKWSRGCEKGVNDGPGIWGGDWGSGNARPGEIHWAVTSPAGKRLSPLSCDVCQRSFSDICSKLWWRLTDEGLVWSPQIHSRGEHFLVNIENEAILTLLKNSAEAERTALQHTVSLWRLPMHVHTKTFFMIAPHGKQLKCPPREMG